MCLAEYSVLTFTYYSTSPCFGYKIAVLLLLVLRNVFVKWFWNTETLKRVRPWHSTLKYHPGLLWFPTQEVLNLFLMHVKGASYHYVLLIWTAVLYCILHLQNYLQPPLRMESCLFDKTYFLLNALNYMNYFPILYFLLSWLLHQLINYFLQGWGQPYWPGAACVTLPALSEFHVNLPGIPTYIKDMPEIFFRQVYRFVGNQISELPALK